jgi:hypothetical protein
MRGRTAHREHADPTFPGRQRRLDDFPPAESTETVTRPDPGSTVHRRVDPGVAPRIAATASGTVVRTDSDRSIVKDTLDRKTPTINPSLTLMGGRPHNYALQVGLPFANTLKYSVAYTVRQQRAQRRRAKLKEKRMPAVGSAEWWNERAWTDQRAPALAIVGRGDQITSNQPNAWTVCSQSQPGSFHHVKKEGGRWECDCAFFGATRKVCVHILAVRYREGLQDSGSAPKEKPRCDRCQSVDVTPDGVRHNRSGEVARYECKGCVRKFSGKEGFHNRRSDPEKIALALDLYFRGLSLRKITVGIQLSGQAVGAPNAG